MKNILVDAHRLGHNAYNGLYSFTEELCNGLIRNNQNNQTRLHFYVPPKQINFFGQKQHYLKQYSVDKFYKFNTKQFDVWHTTTQLSWYRPFNKKTKIIYTIHDFSYLIEDANNLKRNARLLKQTQAKINEADVVTCISQFSLNQALKHLNLKNKVTKVIYNGCNMPPQILETHQPKFKCQQPFLFTIGSLQPRKNFHTLIPLLIGNDYSLIIAGMNHYNYSQQVLSVAEQYGVTNRVHLIGAISSQDKFWYYKNCAAFVFPSFAEGFGLPVIEAMQFGVPTFLANKTCLKEIGGSSAYYFESFDPEHMKEVFENGLKNFNHHTNKALQEQAAKFSWDTAAKEYLNIYNSL